MTAAGRRLVWPDGTVYEITRSTAQTRGELLEMTWELPAQGWAPGPHVHPQLTEEYEVLEGELEVLVDKDWRTLRVGETASIAPGTVHTFRAGVAPARVRNVHRPALDFEPYIICLCETANARRLGRLDGLRALLYVAVLVRRFPQHSTAPGRALQAVVPALAAAGRLLATGVRPAPRDPRAPDWLLRSEHGGRGIERWS